MRFFFPEMMLQIFLKKLPAIGGNALAVNGKAQALSDFPDQQ